MCALTWSLFVCLGAVVGFLCVAVIWIKSACSGGGALLGCFIDSVDVLCAEAVLGRICA